MMRNLLMSLVCLVLVSTLFAGLDPQFKQLAGPPSEFQSGPIRLVQPEETGVRSRSALLPVQFYRSKQGTWTWNGELAVENGARVLVFSPEGSTWELHLRGVNGKRSMPLEALSSEVKDEELALGESRVPGKMYVLDGLASGSYQLEIQASAPRLKSGNSTLDGYIAVDTDSPYRLFSNLKTHELLLGNKIGFSAFGFDLRNNQGAFPENKSDLVQDAYLRATSPSGDVREVPMFDDGQHNDGLANDGDFGADLLADQAGQWLVQVIARGTTAEGNPFLRTVEHSFPVVQPTIALIGDQAKVTSLDDRRMLVSLPADAYDESQNYRVIAEVWGKDANGEAVPACWIGGLSRVEKGELSLGLDARWIGNAGLKAPFELRNVRVEDVEGYVPVSKRGSMTLAVDRLPAAAFERNKKIDQEMLMGPRPAQNQKASGSRLLLVHGYCSGDVWGSQLGKFGSASVFYDLNQNRSHDDFANRIKNFGGSWNSYGIVAHSQGGCASLHLYSYYWSGLDNATGNRLIQSVGTPYQGTALAGNLAALGQVFGAGCGTNNDLTYNGASAWLSGIPTWARAKVNFFTTSFTDNWWSYDYCHVATDLFLTDPEDGTTEKAKGQLSSAVNRGHKTGWCHTNSMRDPGQTSDSSRNSEMNGNAAR